MKETTINSKVETTVRDVPIPTVKPGYVLIHVVVSGTNPKDWKVPEWVPTDNDPKNHGDDIAGYIEAVGEGVLNFKKGDRVAAFHEMQEPHGSFAEYALAWGYTTFHLPDHVSFEGMIFFPFFSWCVRGYLNLFSCVFHSDIIYRSGNH